MWPEVDPGAGAAPAAVGPEYLAAAADGRSAPRTSRRCCCGPNRPVREVGAVVGGRRRAPRRAGRPASSAPPSLSHVVVDEAQDLSADAVPGDRPAMRTGSVTVLGDIAQATTPWATDDWSTVLAHLGKPDGSTRRADPGFRVPAADHRVRRPAAAVDRARPGPPTRCASRPARSRCHVADARALEDELLAGRFCAAASADEGSIGLIAADASMDRWAKSLRGAGIGLLRLDEDQDERGKGNGNGTKRPWTRRNRRTRRRPARRG